MATILEDATLLGKAGEGSEEAEQPDVVGLRVPRKRVLTTLTVAVQVDKLPSRTPRATYEWTEEDE